MYLSRVEEILKKEILSKKNCLSFIKPTCEQKSMWREKNIYYLKN